MVQNGLESLVETELFLREVIDSAGLYLRLRSSSLENGRVTSLGAGAHSNNLRVSSKMAVVSRILSSGLSEDDRDLRWQLVVSPNTILLRWSVVTSAEA